MAQFKLHKRGQSSFEMLLLVVVAIAVAIFILGNYFDLKDSTIALAIVKSDAIEKLNGLDSSYYIKRIDMKEDSVANSICFNVRTNETFSDSLDFADTINTITTKTKYSSAVVKVNASC